MAVMIKRICCIYFFLFSAAWVRAQDIFFTDITATKNFKRENWNFQGAAVWKHVYSDTYWSRIGLKGRADYNYRNWSLEGGLTLYHTFDREIVNSVEVRPWLGIKLTSMIVSDLYLQQECRIEWRNFFYEHFADRDYIRNTYDISLNFSLENINLRSWSLQSGYKWYFIKNAALGERYADSREFRFVIIKQFAKSRLSVGYKREKFKPLSGRFSLDSNTVELIYTFN